MRDSDYDVPLYGFRLEHLEEWHEVTATCSKCRHVALMRHSVLKRGRAGGYLLEALARQLRCSKCGSKGDNVLRVSMIPR